MPPRPHLTEQAQAQRDARVEREAAALRANLRKRKEQARERQDAGPRPETRTGHAPSIPDAER